MVAPNHIKSIQLFFPGVNDHAKSPDVPFPYTQSLVFTGDIKKTHEELIRICAWCRENLEDENLWYINADGYIGDFFFNTVTFVFDFVNVEDHMAFKLRWT